MIADIEYDKWCTAAQENIFVVNVIRIKCLTSLFWLFLQKSVTSSGDVQYNLRMCVAVKRRLQVMPHCCLALFDGSSWAWRSTHNSLWETTLTMWCGAASSRFANCALCDDHWLVKHCAPLSMHSSQVVSTIVTLFSTVSQTASSDDCSQSCMPLHGWSPASDVSTTSRQHFVTHCTGCRYHSASPSKSRWWYLTALVADVRSTSATCTFLCTLWLHVRV